MTEFFAILSFLILCVATIILVIPSIFLLFSFTLTLAFKKRRAATRTISLFSWAKVFFIEWVVVIWVYILRITYDLTHYNLKPKYALTGKQTPIVLLHGYMDCPLTWHFFKKKLETELQRPVISIALRPKMVSIEILAEILSTRLSELKTEYKLENFDLIGHSMGGLVATYCATHYKSKEINSVIALGSPFGGTLLAYAAQGDNAIEMRNNSEFSQRNTVNFEALECLKLQLASDMDNIVVPWHNALNPPATLATSEQALLTECGHASLLFQEQVVKRVVEQYNYWSDSKCCPKSKDEAASVNS